MRIVTFTDREADIADWLYENATRWAEANPGAWTDEAVSLIRSGWKALRQNQEPRTTEEQASGQREVGHLALAREAAGG